MTRLLLAVVLGLSLLPLPQAASATYVPIPRWNDWFINAQGDILFHNRPPWNQGGQEAYYDAITSYAEGIIESVGEEVNIVAMADAYDTLLQLQTVLEVHYVNERDPIKRQQIKRALETVRRAIRAVEARMKSLGIPASEILKYRSRQIFVPPPIVEPTEPRN